MWDRFNHHGTGANPCPITNGDGSQDRGVGAYDDTISEGRVAFLLFEGGAAQDNAFIDETVLADLARLADHDSHSVVDKDSSSDLCPGVNFNPGDSPAEM